MEWCVDFLPVSQQKELPARREFLHGNRALQMHMQHQVSYVCVFFYMLLVLHYIRSSVI